MKMTVYFDGAFWAALVEWQSGKNYLVYRHVFGKEPKNHEIWNFIHQDLQGLMIRQERLIGQISSSAIVPKKKKRTNPKRMQREISKAKNQSVLSTKAQLELQKTHEALKKERKADKRQRKEEEKANKFTRKQAKRHQKHRGH